MLAGFISLSPSFGQNALIPAVRVHYGYILPHAKDLVPYAQTHPFGAELEWNWQLMSQDAWNYCYCYPRTGISLLYINFGNPDVLGSTIAPHLFIEPVLGAGNRIHPSIRFGIGPAFMTRVYDPVSNPGNTFYSSHISFIVLLNGSLNYRITERMNGRLFANFNHISNGGIQNPNRGINFTTFGAGVDYNLRPIPYTKRVRNDSVDLLPDKWRFDLVLFGTGKTDIKGEAHYPVIGIFSNVSHVIGRLSAVALGFEATVDMADRHEIQRLADAGEGELTDHKYLAVLGGYELLIGRFNLNILMGAYLYSPFERMDPVYQRYGLNFRLNDWVFTGISIKAHRHVADFMDFRVGIIF